MADAGKPTPAEHDAHRDKRPTLVDKYEEINKRINREILAARIGNTDNLSDDKMSLLLLIIERCSDGRISLGKKWPGEIFEKYQNLKDELRAAWKVKSYKTIMQLEYLQSLPDPVPPTSVEETPSRESLEATERGKTPRVIEKPFRGKYDEVILDKIDAMYEPVAYKNICAMVQSSGTGKSRLVDQIAKSVFTFPINIRGTNGIVATYPPPDDVLRTHLVDDAPNDEHECKTHYETFFKCLFHHSLDELSKLGSDLVNKWYELMGDADYRQKFYQRVVDLTKSPPSKRVLKDLANKLQPHSTRRIRMMLYIDEAQELKASCKGRSKLDIMCSSSLHLLAPTRTAVTSERARRTTGLLAPITETPFDCFLEEDIIKPGKLHVEDLSTLDHIAKWGRPLWWAMKSEGAAKLIGSARMKLIGLHEINIPYNYPIVKEEALVAVLDVLLAFDFEPNRELNEDTQAELVRSHMRMAYSVPQHRLYLRSGYPSEPLLAEAAAQQLHAFRERAPKELRGGNIFGFMVAMLNKNKLLSSTLIDVGQRGEVFMRMCLMGAYMDGVLHDFGSKTDIIFSKGCKLTTFIEQLFESSYAEEILKATPDNVASDKTFAEAFERSMVRFTHFVKAGDSMQISSEAMFGAFVRGMAFIGYQTQQAVDFAIPVLLDKTNTLGEPVMSAILIQVKRRVRGRGASAYSFSEGDVDFFPTEGKAVDNTRPYFTVVAEMGIEPEVGTVAGTPTPSVRVSPQGSKHHPTNDHPRYAIVVYGCTNVYKSFDDQAMRALFLATRDFAAEHADYGVLKSHDVMMRLKPVWECGKNSYHWLDSKLLQTDQKEKAEKALKKKGNPAITSG